MCYPEWYTYVTYTCIHGFTDGACVADKPSSEPRPTNFLLDLQMFDYIAVPERATGMEQYIRATDIFGDSHYTV